MPMYDFQCQDENCGTQFETRQKSDDPNPPCTACGKETKRLISLPQKPFGTIVMDTPNAKKYKAGYQHSHGTNYRAEKISASVPSNFVGSGSKGSAT